MFVGMHEPISDKFGEIFTAGSKSVIIEDSDEVVRFVLENWI